MEVAHRRPRYELTVDRRERHANRILCDMRQEERREGLESLRSERRNRDLRNGHEAGSSSNPPSVVPAARQPLVPLLTEAEAHELSHTNTPVPRNSELLPGWTRNIMTSIPVAPRLAGQARLDYIEHIMAGRPELQDDPGMHPNAVLGRSVGD